MLLALLLSRLRLMMCPHVGKSMMFVTSLSNVTGWRHIMTSLLKLLQGGDIAVCNLRTSI